MNILVSRMFNLKDNAKTQLTSEKKKQVLSIPAKL